MAFRKFIRDFTFTDDKGNGRVIPSGWYGELSDAVAKAADDAHVTVDESKSAAGAVVAPTDLENIPISKVGLGKPPEPLVQENPVILPGGRLSTQAPDRQTTTTSPFVNTAAGQPPKK